MEKKHNHIALLNITKKELDIIKEELGNISYDKLMTYLIIEYYKNKK